MTIRILILFFCSISCLAQSVKSIEENLRIERSSFPVLNSNLSFNNITPYCSIFEDKSSEISFEKVQQQSFLPQEKEMILFPFSPNTYWLKVRILNTNNTQKDLILEWDNSLTENVGFHIPGKNGTYQVTEMGVYSSQKEFTFSEYNPHVSLTLLPKQEQTIYIRLKSNRGYNASLKLYSSDAYRDAFLKNTLKNGFIYGLIFLRLFYVLFIAFFAVKELAFRQYSILVVMRSVAFLGLSSVLGGIFTSDPIKATLINFISYHILPIGQVLVVMAILPINKFHFTVKITLRFISAITVILGIIIIFDYRWNWLLTSSYLIIFTQIFIIGLYIFALFRKYSFNKYYSIPFLLGIGSNVFLQMRLVGWVDFAWILPFALFCFVSEIFVFGLFLGRIIINYERTRANAEKQLIFTQTQSNKLKELDQLKTNFFTNISHEFRTPLTLILGPIEDLKNRNPKDEVYGIIQRNSNRLLELINQLLDISKLESGLMKLELKETDLVKYFRTLTSSFTSLAESKEISFEFTQNQSNITGLIDQDKVEKIITNLLSNAFKFTKKGGTVNVKISYFIGSQRVIIEITDTGIGIAKEKLSKIFDRFYQVDDGSSHDSLNRKYEGTGIGLALVKELVDTLKGTIRVESQENEGTSFYVNLPIEALTLREKGEAVSLVDEETKILEQPISTTPPEAILLIVDDNADIRTYIRGIFQDDYQVIEAIDGKDGLLKAYNHIPNLIISDLMMPKMDGFEFCKILKSDEKTSHIPVIMLTAKANIESRIEGLELGADDYLIKPFNEIEIKVRVRNLIEKQEKLRQYFVGKTIELKPNEVRVNSIEEVFLKKAKDIIEKNLAESTFGVEQFSQEMNMSSSQLLRKIKALTNQTPNEFIRDFRLQRAAALLDKKTGTVSEIAFDVGFENLSYFSKVFQEKYGKFPSEY